jgi:hypothetical protein
MRKKFDHFGIVRQPSAELREIPLLPTAGRSGAPMYVVLVIL